MQKGVRDRLITIVICVSLSAFGVYIVLSNLENNIVFFLPPSKLHQIDTSKELRIGGVVKAGSIEKIGADGVQFVVTDDIADLQVFYRGVLPSLFREGQGIIVTGKISGNKFIAKELLTKHDENYYPPSSK